MSGTRIFKYYQEEVRKQYGEYYATWLPGKPIELGDIGTFTKNEFKLVKNIKDFGVKFPTRRDKSPMPFYFRSLEGLDVEFKPSGELNPKYKFLPSAKAGFGIVCKKAGKFIFKAKEIYLDCIDDLIMIGERCTAFVEANPRKKYVIIDRLIRAPMASILISIKKNTMIELSIKSNIPLPKADLADVDLDFSIESPSESSFSSLNIPKATPFYGARDLRDLAEIAEHFRAFKEEPLGAEPKVTKASGGWQTIKGAGSGGVRVPTTYSSGRTKGDNASGELIRRRQQKEDEILARLEGSIVKPTTLTEEN